MTDFRTLKDFIVLARVRSFSQASIHCNVTTSGLSRRITALEEWLGVSLFDRARHQLELTDAGLEFHVAAVEVVELLEKTRNSVIRTQEKYRRKISIVAPHIMSRAFFPAWLPRVSNQLEATRFSIDFANLPECFKQLTHRSVDFVVAFEDIHNGINEHLKKTVSLGELECLKIGREWLVPVSAPNLLGEPLNYVGSPKAEISYLHYRQDCSLSWALEKMLKINTNLPALRKIHDSSLADGLRSMAITGLGVAWLPLEIVRNDLERKDLVRAGDPAFDIALEINIYRRKEKLGANAEILWDNLSSMKDVSGFSVASTFASFTTLS
jgi:LysR family transcriptional regulator, hypochlorite-specific transcription factor HypT